MWMNCWICPAMWSGPPGSRTYWWTAINPLRISSQSFWTRSEGCRSFPHLRKNDGIPPFHRPSFISHLSSSSHPPSHPFCHSSHQVLEFKGRLVIFYSAGQGFSQKVHRLLCFGGRFSTEVLAEFRGDLYCTPPMPPFYRIYCIERLLKKKICTLTINNYTRCIFRPASIGKKRKKKKEKKRKRSYCRCG